MHTLASRMHGRPHSPESNWRTGDSQGGMKAAPKPAGPRPAQSIVFLRMGSGPSRHGAGTPTPRLRRPMTALADAEREILKIGRCGHFCGHRCGRPRPSVEPMTPTYRTLQTPEERLVYTVAEAGEMLGISRAFAYELVARGELPVIRLGRRRLVPKAGLLALVGQAEATAPSDLD
jgi:excisionase family DNA binding protein